MVRAGATEEVLSGRTQDGRRMQLLKRRGAEAGSLLFLLPSTPPHPKHKKKPVARRASSVGGMEELGVGRGRSCWVCSLYRLKAKWELFREIGEADRVTGLP